MYLIHGKLLNVFPICLLMFVLQCNSIVWMFCFACLLVCLMVFVLCSVLFSIANHLEIECQLFSFVVKNFKLILL